MLTAYYECYRPSIDEINKMIETLEMIDGIISSKHICSKSVIQCDKIEIEYDENIITNSDLIGLGAILCSIDNKHK